MTDQKNALRRGIWWLRDPANPVLPPVAGSDYDSNCCMNPWVVRIDDDYRVYYSGADAKEKRRICMAQAPVEDPGNFVRHGVVLDRGEDGDFDYSWAVLPHVIKFPDKWHLYYSGNCGYGEGLSSFPGLGVAFSDDGINFEKYEN
ncbi:MAG: hypothetical protein MJH11_07310, partial [Lentisphaeria bacterium]|nr:hypothetical protein [Lentisphaeria bacterium]